MKRAAKQTAKFKANITRSQYGYPQPQVLVEGVEGRERNAILYSIAAAAERLTPSDERWPICISLEYRVYVEAQDEPHARRAMEVLKAARDAVQATLPGQPKRYRAFNNQGQALSVSVPEDES